MIPGPRDARARFLLRVEAPRMHGWVELSSTSRVTARAEASRSFRACTVTLYERSDDEFGYVRIGIVSEPASASVVEGVAS